MRDDRCGGVGKGIYGGAAFRCGLIVGIECVARRLDQRGKRVGSGFAVRGCIRALCGNLIIGQCSEKDGFPRNQMCHVKGSVKLGTECHDRGFHSSTGNRCDNGILLVLLKKCFGKDGQCFIGGLFHHVHGGEKGREEDCGDGDGRNKTDTGTCPFAPRGSLLLFINRRHQLAGKRFEEDKGEKLKDSEEKRKDNGGDEGTQKTCDQRLKLGRGCQERLHVGGKQVANAPYHAVRQAKSDQSSKDKGRDTDDGKIGKAYHTATDAAAIPHEDADCQDQKFKN